MLIILIFDMKLSIILTVYNKEPFLQRSLEALFSQDQVNEGEYEVVAINDGSTDGSQEFLQSYAKKESRLRVYSQDNQGLSMARNNGIEKALGDYVWFVDSDDVISSRSVRLICDTIDSKPDVIPIYAETKGDNYVRNKVPITALSGKDVLLCKKWEHCGVFWIIRRNFLLEHCIFFMKGVFHEDSEFTPRMLYKAKHVSVIPTILYTVIHEPNSITSIPKPKRAFDCLEVASSLYAFVSINQDMGRTVRRVFYDTISMIINNSFSIIIQNPINEQSTFNDEFKKKILLIHPLLKSRFKYRVEALLFSLFPGRYVQVYKCISQVVL